PRLLHRHDGPDNSLLVDVVNEEFGFGGRPVLIQFVVGRRGGEDDCFPAQPRGDPMDHVTTEWRPNTIEIARFRIVPAEATSHVPAFAESAEINPAVRPEGRTVHDRNTRFPELTAEARIARGTTLTGRGVGRRSASTQRPRSRGIIDEQRTPWIAA